MECVLSRNSTCGGEREKLVHHVGELAQKVGRVEHRAGVGEVRSRVII